MRRAGPCGGFTLVEVLIALALSAALFAAALNLLLGIVTAWERARTGDFLSDEKVRRFAFLHRYMGPGAEDEVRVEALPGDSTGRFLNFAVRSSPLLAGVSAEWRTERFALIHDRGSVGLMPVVGEDADRPRANDALPLFGEGVEVLYWTRDEARDRWEETDRLETRGGADPPVPGYLLIRTAEGDERWIRVGTGEGDLALW